jgi:phospholipid/cholesterol/gamma-HCH transport system substrate-binding protein
MERNARTIMVASFVLITLVLLLLFYQWIQGADSDEMQTAIPIQFEGSVSGLSIGSDVRYLGVPVGRVTSINLSREYPGRVDVVFGSDQLLPDPATMAALLEAQGITGLSVVELRTRSTETPGFEVAPGTIPGYPSVFSQLAGSAGRITGSVETTLGRLDELLNAETAADLRVTISELRILSTNLARSSQDFDTLIGSTTRISQELEQTLPEFRAVAVRLDAEVLPAITAAGRSLQAATDSMANALGENGAGLTQLMQKDLPTLIGITDDLSRSLQAFDELLGDVNNQPGVLLYGEQMPEVEISRD